MSELTIKKLNCWFDERIAECRQQSKALFNDERRDEAELEKIRANVYDIFRTVLSAGVKACKGDEADVRSFFEQKCEQIPSNWLASLEKASQHGDELKVRIEQLKLDTIGEIKESFALIWEEEQ